MGILYSRFSRYNNSDEVAILADRLVRPAPTKTTFWRNQNEKNNNKKNATQYTHWLIYWLAIVRQRKDASPAKCYLLNRQRICILPGTSRPSAETNRSRFGVGLGLILTPNMATSRSTSGRLSRGYSYLDPAVWLCSAVSPTRSHTLIWA